jgi:2'-5' RNA ligase
MPYAVELALDPVTAAVVRRVWRELDDAGIESAARSGARPHVSLGIWEALHHEGAAPELARFAAETRPIPLTFTSVGLFPGAAIFLAPTVTAELLELHAGFHRRFGGFGQRSWEYYWPGHWVPHCTLAMDLETRQCDRVLTIAGRAPLPLPGRLVEVGIVEFRPVKQLVTHPLGAR